MTYPNNTKTCVSNSYNIYCLQALCTERPCCLGVTIGKKSKCWTAKKGSPDTIDREGATTALKICMNVNEEEEDDCNPDSDSVSDSDDED